MWENGNAVVILWGVFSTSAVLDSVSVTQTAATIRPNNGISVCALRANSHYAPQLSAKQMRFSVAYLAELLPE